MIKNYIQPYTRFTQNGMVNRRSTIKALLGRFVAFEEAQATGGTLPK